MSKYSDIESKAEPIALGHCKGKYQVGIILGQESLSGSTLRGVAKSYGYHYACSRQNLLKRLRADNRLQVTEERRAHGRRTLVIKAI